MCAKARKEPRYKILGRVEASELSALPGMLIDISLSGCKFHYTVPVAVDLENDYSLTIKVSDNNSSSDLNLICHPVWVCEDSGETDMGMQILHSPDTDKLKEFVDSLNRSEYGDGSESQIVDNSCQFI